MPCGPWNARVLGQGSEVPFFSHPAGARTPVHIGGKRGKVADTGVELKRWITHVYDPTHKN